MQFVRQGPDIPERLLQLHEEGKVVFFCGAGISYPANLPGFAGLVDRLYKSMLVSPDEVQKSAIKSQKFDTAISLLESKLTNGRERIRKELGKILSPSTESLAKKKSTDTHDALLTLSRNLDGQTRLITTNFDRLFEHVINTKNLNIQKFKAPFLPIPKNRFDGLVYLHGLLGEDPSQSHLEHLVLSSGDFGLAYLTERWAARFVSELFRNYTVCFVGYSIADPVLRYMMDALAADRLLGESPPEMFAFGSFKKGKEIAVANEWNAKNVTPILYREHRNHFFLHKTLQKWADTYHNRASGKEQIVVETAIAKPMASTKQDDFVGRMLWALCDKSGLPAKRFAELDPVPSLEWLQPFSEENFSLADLGRFGVFTGKSDPAIKFSLIDRPTPYRLAPKMSLVGRSTHIDKWDDVMHHLANWLCRHLDDPRLLLWIVNSGGHLHTLFITALEQRLNKIFELEKSGNTVELDRIRLNAANAIPQKLMRKLWGLVLSGRIKANSRRNDVYFIVRKIENEGITIANRLALRDALTPYISLKEPFRFDSERSTSGAQNIRELVSWDLQISSWHVHTPIREISQNDDWKKALPSMFNDFNSLLKDALDLMFELKDPNDNSDQTQITRPSIADHHQNKDHRDWTILIELTRDAWLAIAALNKHQAIIHAQIWINNPYPIFKRLAFFAATHSEIITPRMALDFISIDDFWWLWSSNTQREMFRLIAKLGPNLNKQEIAELENAIIAGPPESIFRAKTEDSKRNRVVERVIWHRLKVLSDSGANLTRKGSDALSKLSNSYPTWKLSDNQREEFPYWIETSWESGSSEPWGRTIAIPSSVEGIVNYLIENPKLNDGDEDKWRELCSTNYADTSAALIRLSQRDLWPTERWKDALQAWSEGNLAIKAWSEMSPILVLAPHKAFKELRYYISYWLYAVSGTITIHNDIFLNLAKRILKQKYKDEDNNTDPVTLAINHPIGKTTQALLYRWYQNSLEDGQGLPKDLKPLFSKLCDTSVKAHQHGRVILASHLLNLFRIDPDWAITELLPSFNWERSQEVAKSSWEGFLWSPRLHWPLIEHLKPDLFESARYYDQLDEHREQFASFLTYAAIESTDIFKPAELAIVFRTLPLEGLKHTATALANMLESAGDRREEYWKNRIHPFMDKIWPRFNDQKLEDTEPLARICIAARVEFPSAFQLLKAQLTKSQYPNYLLHLLKDSKVCTLYPEEALRFLLILLDENSLGIRSELEECLNQIASSLPSSVEDINYRKLLEILRRSQF